MVVNWWLLVFFFGWCVWGGDLQVYMAPLGPSMDSFTQLNSFGQSHIGAIFYVTNCLLVNNCFSVHCVGRHLNISVQGLTSNKSDSCCLRLVRITKKCVT